MVYAFYAHIILNTQKHYKKNLKWLPENCFISVADDVRGFAQFERCGKSAGEIGVVPAIDLIDSAFQPRVLPLRAGDD